MIEIDPEICAGCQKCCHGIPGNTIPAKLSHGKTLRYNKYYQCEQLNKRNHCNMGLAKPIECQLYPIVIFGDEVYVDMACPAWKSAVTQWYERFSKDIDSYGNDEHKFVKLYLAKMIKE
jgi:Fe-S-cluster containining protein